ncbi:MAG: hypothetical protein ACRDK3_05210 [Actinomycetota bacterium]
MAGPSEPPRIDEKRRLLMRLAALALGYLAYRLLEPRSLAGALLVGFGVWLVGVSRVERELTPEPAERQRRIQFIGTRVGVAMIAVGTVLAVR